LTFFGLILLPLSGEVLGPGDESYREMPLVKSLPLRSRQGVHLLPQGLSRRLIFRLSNRQTISWGIGQ
jgi:hypothetical protein